MTALGLFNYISQTLNVSKHCCISVQHRSPFSKTWTYLYFWSSNKYQAQKILLEPCSYKKYFMWFIIA